MGRGGKLGRATGGNAAASRAALGAAAGMASVCTPDAAKPQTSPTERALRTWNTAFMRVAASGLSSMLSASASPVSPLKLTSGGASRRSGITAAVAPPTAVATGWSLLSARSSAGPPSLLKYFAAAPVKSGRADTTAAADWPSKSEWTMPSAAWSAAKNMALARSREHVAEHCGHESSSDCANSWRVHAAHWT